MWMNQHAVQLFTMDFMTIKQEEYWIQLFCISHSSELGSVAVEETFSIPMWSYQIKEVFYNYKLCVIAGSLSVGIGGDVYTGICRWCLLEWLVMMIWRRSYPINWSLELLSTRNYLPSPFMTSYKQSMGDCISYYGRTWCRIRTRARRNDIEGIRKTVTTLGLNDISRTIQWMLSHLKENDAYLRIRNEHLSQ